MSRGKRKLSKYLCMLLSVMMTAAILGVPVRAEEADNVVLDLANGKIQIDAGRYSQGSTNGPLPTGSLIITGKYPGGSSDSVIWARGAGKEYNITFRDVEITTSGAPAGGSLVTRTPFRIEPNTTVRLTLEGKSTLINNSNLGAGIWVMENAHLIIQAKDENQSLECRGTIEGAGIGSGNSGYNSGRITIENGTIDAVGGGGSAGIGGVHNQDANKITVTGDITINGGRVTATGGSHQNGLGGGAGIGGGAGSNARVGKIQINGGTVIAMGAELLNGITPSGGGGAGIGGGSFASGGTVIINGGTVTAKGAGNSKDRGAPGIGGGTGSDLIDGGTLSSDANGTAWIVQTASACQNFNASVEGFQTGILFDGTTGNGCVYGNYVLEQARSFQDGCLSNMPSKNLKLEVLPGSHLEIPMEYQLTGPGTLLNNGAVTISRSANLNNLTLQDGTGAWQFRGLTDVMLKASNLTYTGSDLTSEAGQKVGLDSSVKEISLLNKTFQVVTTEADVASGWNRVFNPGVVQEKGLYTATYTHKTVTSESAQKTFRVVDPGYIPMLDSIAVTTPPTQTEFTYGDPIRFNGMVVTANYEDGSSKAGISYTVETPTENLPVGTHTITLSYTEEGVKKTCTVDIKINRKKLTWNTSGLTARDTAGSIANNNATLSGELKLDGILSADQSLVNYSAPSSKLSGKYTDTTAGNRTVNITWKNQNDIPALSGSRAGNYELPELPVTITGTIAANSSNMNTNNNAGSNNNNSNNNTTNNNNNGNNNTAGNNNNNGSNNTNTTNNNTSNNNNGTSSGNNNSSNNTNTTTSSNNTAVGGIKTSDMAPIALYTVLLCASLAAMLILPGCYTAEVKARKPDSTRRYENYRR